RPDYHTYEGMHPPSYPSGPVAPPDCHFRLGSDRPVSAVFEGGFAENRSTMSCGKQAGFHGEKPACIELFGRRIGGNHKFQPVAGGVAIRTGRWGRPGLGLGAEPAAIDDRRNKVFKIFTTAQ